MRRKDSGFSLIYFEQTPQLMSLRGGHPEPIGSAQDKVRECSSSAVEGPRRLLRVGRRNDTALLRSAKVGEPENADRSLI